MMGRRIIAFAICCTLYCMPASCWRRQSRSKTLSRLRVSLTTICPKKAYSSSMRRCSRLAGHVAAELHTEIAPDHPAIKNSEWDSLLALPGSAGIAETDAQVGFAAGRSEDGRKASIKPSPASSRCCRVFSQSVSPFLFTSMLPNPRTNIRSKHGKSAFSCVQGRLKRCVPDPARKTSLSLKQSGFF